ncbi:hypothetical protein C8A01DRAFT_19947 [Parachaetomium inaequale]|uniref:Uncharacterized protein n=1 Tax=Parachaetomium inaequale TaxID=2588326 RepID=A0AAN6P796_9PEZI|nr:hypothetical protein C8A01DRAFT_19947 [Parachaetomium inaequale]
MAVVLGIAIVRCLARDPDTNSPDGPSPEDLEAVCDAHGHLQLLASCPGDPITAFEILMLDPSARPFFPRKASLPRPEMWHDEIYDTVMAPYTAMAEAMERHDGRGGDAHNKQYMIALTRSADLLLKDGPRRYYLDTVLPMLERAIQGQPRQCVWPSVSEFNHNLCAGSWSGTGVADLLRDHHISHDHRCVDGFGILDWLERLGLWS